MTTVPANPRDGTPETLDDADDLGARGGRRAALPRALPVDEIIERTGALRSGPLPVAPFRSLRTDDRARTGDLFVAIRGTAYDAHRAIPRLPGSGILGVIAESAAPPEYPLPWFRVDDSRRALARLEQARWGDPAARLRVFGVTGTNGKSTTVRLLAAVLAAAGEECGWITTVSRSIAGREEPGGMTTPGAGELAEALARQAGRGGSAFSLEVSSHALDQHRVEGIPFAGGAIVNLSRDHLDYHGDLRSYRDAKLRLAAHLSPGAPFVIPATSEFRGELPAPWREGLRGPLLRHALAPSQLEGDAGGTVREASLDATGIVAELEILGERLRVRSTLRGRHNLENILVAATLARAAGIPAAAVAEGIARSPTVRGRLEEVPGARGRVFIDYAHTPDALAAVLGALREWGPRRLLVVFGCGGDRDRGKRPLMGAIAERHADRVYVTSDNPRSEEPGSIIAEVLAGIAEPERVVVEPDRRAAIEKAVMELEEGELLVVAGKGHETEQVVAGARFPFDDRAVVAELLASRAGR